MDDSVTITSAHDGTRLTFANVAGESFDAIIENRAFSGRVVSSTYHSGPPSLLFSEMAVEWRGWQGIKQWAALEDELLIKATADLTGHVALAVIMRASNIWAGWRLEATICLEAGQLEYLAREMDRLFRQASVL